MKIVAITQARYSSSRLPGKVLLKLGESTVLDLHLQRIRQSKRIDEWIVATTKEKESDQIIEIAKRNNCQVYQGDLNDVLDRFYQAVKDTKADYVIRFTSDCPLIDPAYIDDLIRVFLEKNVDYACNCLKPTLPDGMDAEIFTFKALEDAWKNAKKKSEREHVTPFIRDCGKFKVYSLEYKKDLSKYRLTLDTPEDYELISQLVSACGENFSMEGYLDYLISNPDLFSLNSKYERNEGYTKSLKGDSSC